MKKIYMIIAAVALLSSCNGEKVKNDASGTFESTEIIVSSEATGKIIRLDLKEGDIVKAGITYGIVDTTQLLLKKEQLEASINSVKSRRQDVGKQVSHLKEQLKKLKEERERINNLIEASATNTKQLDDINSSISILTKQIDAQESSLKSANLAIEGEAEAMRAQVAQIEDQLQKCKITSPITGTVLAKYAEQGEITSMGKPIFKIADIDNMQLRAYISASQLTQIKIGQKVKILSDYGDKQQKEYDGIISWISDKSEFTPKTIQTKDERVNLVYSIKVDVKNDGFLKIGMYGDVIF